MNIVGHNWTHQPVNIEVKIPILDTSYIKYIIPRPIKYPLNVIHPERDSYNS